jgi:hypothetical protein
MTHDAASQFSIGAKAEEAAWAWGEQQHELFAALDEVNTIAGAGVGWFSVARILNQTCYSGFWSLPDSHRCQTSSCSGNFPKLNGRLCGRNDLKPAVARGSKFLANPLRVKRNRLR